MHVGAAEAERNLRLFAAEVMPEIRKIAVPAEPAAPAPRRGGRAVEIGLLGT